ncbi:MAG TPA: endonuclease Q family protein, partial [Pseudomonadota bacterium]|nr:endonuclease Q family protein [Pseudomonadota bacterium]
MELLLDLHVHSRFSRAVSADMDLGHMYQWAQRKGIDIVATGDVLHPAWRAEMRAQLVPADDGLGHGLYELDPGLREPLDQAIPRSCRRKVRFILSGEISHIFKKDGAVRKVHNLIVLPSLDVADQVADRLLRLGYNLHSDGRPILGMPCRDFLELLLSTDAAAYLVPAHIWTPHFSVFGSQSGFDRLSDCFGDLTPHIFALETGLSSDPTMNWRLSALDSLSLVSSSDAHSPQKLGRELTRLDIPSPPTFVDVRRALEVCSPDEFLGTIEFFPEEGKYHLDGHRDCGVRLEPGERAALAGL